MAISVATDHPWQQILGQFVGSAGRIGRRTTSEGSHRRFGHRTSGVRIIVRQNLLVAVDVSDSPAQQTLREAFATELLQVARRRESRLTVLYTGSRIQRVETFSGTPPTIEVYAGGGCARRSTMPGRWFPHRRRLST